MNFYTSNFSLHPSADDSNLALSSLIASHIAGTSSQRITFAHYMDLVLYHPQHGYYGTKALNLGSQGDFFTSPHLGADFGEILAEQFVQMWEILGQPKPFTLVEMGAGQGILAGDILKYIQQHYPDFFAALEYIIVEKSTTLKQEQQQRLQTLPLQWCSLDEIPLASITGCCFSNELVDALPVHQVMITQGQLREIYVTTKDASSFKEVIDEISTSRLVEYFDLIEVELPSSIYPDGYRTEVNLAALDWLSMVAKRLKRGYLLTIDYGYPAKRYYNQMRSQGTLQCYYRHHRHHNPYINVGQQDITAHVDFTALEIWGKLCGLNNLGLTQQGLFLMALGLGDRIANLSSTTNQSISQILRQRDALHQLIDPLGLGGFGVLIQAKGLSAAQIAQPLKGLATELS